MHLFFPLIGKGIRMLRTLSHFFDCSNVAHSTVALARTNNPVTSVSL